MREVNGSEFTDAFAEPPIAVHEVPDNSMNEDLQDVSIMFYGFRRSFFFDVFLV
jgi:hypothetical protein